MRRTLEEVTGYEVPTERAEESEQEEPFSRDSTTLANSGVLLRMEGVEERASDQVGRPDHRRRCDQEASCNAADGKPDLRKISAISLCGTRE